MTLPPGFEVNVDVPWVDVNATWDARPWHDPEFIALQDQAVAAQAAAEAAWAVEFPQLAAALDPIAILNPITRERVLGYAEPAVRGILTAAALIVGVVVALVAVGTAGERLR